MNTDKNSAADKIVGSTDGLAVVWPDDATPFTGAQVKELLDENKSLRKENKYWIEQFKALERQYEWEIGKGGKFTG